MMGKSTRKRKSVKSVPEEEMAGSKQSVEEEIVNLQSEKSTIIEEAE